MFEERVRLAPHRISQVPAADAHADGWRVVGGQVLYKDGERVGLVDRISTTASGWKIVEYYDPELARS